MLPYSKQDPHYQKRLGFRGVGGSGFRALGLPKMPLQNGTVLRSWPVPLKQMTPRLERIGVEADGACPGDADASVTRLPEPANIKAFAGDSAVAQLCRCFGFRALEGLRVLTSYPKQACPASVHGGREWGEANPKP